METNIITRLLSRKRTERTEVPVDLPEKTRTAARRKVLEALKAGERLDMFDAARFRVCDMHTIIARVRELIEGQKLPYVVRSEWKDVDGFRCKEYWLETIEDNQLQQEKI